MATLEDVARRAGVSLATASRVINGTSHSVADELRARVLAAVEELQYVPNAHAQMLARSRRATVGVIVHDVSDPYFAEITRGLQRVATDSGLLLMICNSYRDPEREVAYVELLHAHQVAAVILAGSGYRSADVTRAINAKLTAYARSGGRVAVIGRHELAGDAVMPENESGGYVIAEALLDLGHERIGVIGGPEELTTTADRLGGVRRAFRTRGRALPGRSVTYGDFTCDGGERAAAELLDRDPDLTALLALNDEMAVGALMSLRARGVRVPEQVSVAGFDDMPVARQVTPALTTVHLPMVEMGALAMRLALQPPADGQRVERIPARIVHRESAARPPGV
ncbi:MAG: LacI family DNA-binding transcriptional regulator [Streptosporangiales bacterium]|nr:LacI family DNA-binding transcriptional regulator [Streptosporangiales bacterium]